MTAVAVVGLGPAGADLLVPRARAILEAADVRFARTARHPAVVDLAAEGLAFSSLDHHYESSDDLEDAYEAIVREVLAAAAGGARVAYAVPGNPGVAERTVALLRVAGAELELVPGVSFIELAWAAAGVDPLAGGRVLDGRRLDRVEVLAGGPALVAQVDTPAVLSGVKLTLLETLGPQTPVVALQRLGSRDERVHTVELAELDRSVDPDHLTTLCVDLGPGAGGEFSRFVSLMETLRGPGGCPWDAEQTHHSLTRHLVEEAYEVVEVLDALPPEAPEGPVDPEAYDRVRDELGDLVAQVVFHATLAREAGAFTIDDVVRGIHDKLVRRHPHVFPPGEGAVAPDLDDPADAAGVMRNWEQIKAQEKGQEEGQAASFVGDVPMGLPALLLAHKLLRKAEALGFDPMTPGEAAAAIARDAVRLGDPDAADAERVAGEILAAVALIARAKGFDAEGALRHWATRFRDRFRRLEALAAADGVGLDGLDAGALAALWIRAGAPA